MADTRSIYINGHLTPAGSIAWQVMPSGIRGPLVRIGFHVSSSSKPQRRSTFDIVEGCLTRLVTSDPDNYNWFTFAKRTWKINATRLRCAFPELGMVQWLGAAEFEIEPEFEESEDEVFGRARYTGHIYLYITPDDIAPSLPEDSRIPELERLRVLVFHGPDNASKHELLAWLRGPDIQANALTVGEMVGHSDGTVDERVKSQIDWAEKAIAIVTPDNRSPSGAPNVIDEIGRWRGTGREADLVIVRQRICDDLWSNLAGIVRLEFDVRIKETFLGLAKFLGALHPPRR